MNETGSPRPAAVMPIAWAGSAEADRSPVRGFFTLREGGVSAGPHGALDGRRGLNLGAACGDDPDAVAANRARVVAAIGCPVRWLRQVHGADVHDADARTDGGSAACDARATPASPCRDAGDAEPRADAAFTTRTDLALAIQVADCLPVVVAAQDGSIVGVAHAGWRGLAGGVLEALVGRMRARRPGAELAAWLGPRIGPGAFEVGADVLDAFVSSNAQARAAFTDAARAGKWYCDLGMLATGQLRRLGIDRTIDTRACTFADATRFWSFRRDRACGRMAAIVALRAPAARPAPRMRPRTPPV
ncbi:MAG: peptidoglycan editing factor PgeF [Lautropia sp.]